MLRACFLVLPALVVATAAWAVLEETDDAPPPPTPTTSVCADGQVWDDVTSSCIDPETGALDDDRLFAAGRELAHAGSYDEALRVLGAMQAQGSPRVLTAMGYAQRKAGRVADGLALYAAALASDPDYHLARSYLGQHHVEQGDPAAAQAQLAEIEARGGGGGWPHAALRRAIAGEADPY